MGLKALRARFLVEVVYRARGGFLAFTILFAIGSQILGVILFGLTGGNYWKFLLYGMIFLMCFFYILSRVAGISNNSAQRLYLVRKAKPKSAWILREGNAEIRRAIIEKLGWTRILSDLGGKIIDKWDCYELYQIKPKDSIIRESFHLLKMKCASTDSDYVHCVPPSTKTAWDAIKWMNKGIEPEQFKVQA